jgi:putative PIN family toxin of toxin-antitoxin system
VNAPSIVLDTNIVISGLLWQGPSHRIIKAAIKGEVTLYASLPLLAELQDVLARPKFAPRLQAANVTAAILLADYENLVTLIEPAVIPPTSADPDDDAVLACALAANAQAIVSGDDHLLTLNSFRDIPIYTAVAFLTLLEAI